jgi:hypothetical protein
MKLYLVKLVGSELNNSKEVGLYDTYETAKQYADHYRDKRIYNDIDTTLKLEWNSSEANTKGNSLQFENDAILAKWVAFDGSEYYVVYIVEMYVDLESKLRKNI